MVDGQDEHFQHPAPLHPHRLFIFLSIYLYLSRSPGLWIDEQLRVRPRKKLCWNMVRWEDMNYLRKNLQIKMFQFFAIILNFVICVANVG